jgi:hypothetical protein
MRKTIPALFSCFALTFSATLASADDVGTPGTLAALQVTTDSADTHLQFHGRLFVKNVNGNIDEYRWGGTSCGSRTLTEEQTATLQRALHSKQVHIRPLHQDGQGQTICLVGFTLLPKQSLKLSIP